MIPQNPVKPFNFNFRAPTGVKPTVFCKTQKSLTSCFKTELISSRAYQSLLAGVHGLTQQPLPCSWVNMVTSADTTLKQHACHWLRVQSSTQESKPTKCCRLRKYWACSFGFWRTDCLSPGRRLDVGCCWPRSARCPVCKYSFLRLADWNA